LDDARDGCATGLRVRVRFSSSYVSPPASGRHRTRARASRQARLTFDVPTVSEQLARFVRSAGYCVDGLSLARAARRGLPIWEYCVALLPSLFGFGSSGAFSPRSTGGAVHIRIRLDWESLFATPTPTPACTVSKSKGDSTLRPDDYIYLSLSVELSLNSTRFLWDILSSVTHTRLYAMRGYTHARTQEGYFILVHCTVV
jgi:hypothetical protein